MRDGRWCDHTHIEEIEIGVELLLDHGEDRSLSKSSRVKRFNMNAMKHSSRMGRIAAFVEAVRLLDWIVIL